MDRIPQSFWRFIISEFLSTQGLIIDLFIFVISGFIYYKYKDSAIPVELAILFVVMTCIVILTMFQAAYKLYNLAQKSLPKILTVKRMPAASFPLGFICILEPSEFFSHGIFVSFYNYDGTFEQLIGIGQVVNIQQDGKIQVVMLGQLDGYDEVVDRLREGHADTLSNIVIKPTVPRRDVFLPVERMTLQNE